MSKMTKTDLKNIVKECLLEILSEGIGQTQKDLIENKRHKENIQQNVNSTNSRRPASHLMNAVKLESGGNKIMASILADTAASTLPKMLEGEGRRGAMPTSGGAAEQLVASAEPEELFGESASRWANLAFMESSPKK